MSLLAVPGQAFAYQDATELLRDDTARIQDKGEWRLGLWRFGVGVFPWMTAETHLAPWIIKAPNLGLRFRILDKGTHRLSARAGAVFANLRNINSESPDVRFGLFPLEIWASQVLSDRWNLSAGLVYTAVVAKGDYESADLEGAAGFSNLQMGITLEFRISRSFVVFLKSRHLLTIQVTGSATTTQQLDPYTTIEAMGTAQSGDLASMGFPQTFAVIPGFVWTRKHFNLSLGLGYGNYNVPVVNFMIPTRMVCPELDLYWVW